MSNHEVGNWGVLAPDIISSRRRQQNLGLSAAVRHFNDCSVPGIGGMWFPIPLLWSILAVHIAEKQNMNALIIANAVEARVMKSVIDISADPRIRGRRKLSSIDDLSFANLSRRGVYITQPIRMSLVQPLVALGYVKGSRFGSFRLAKGGEEVINLPEMADCVAPLLSWVVGENARGFDGVLNKISPISPVAPSIAKHILDSLLDGNDDATRRRRCLAKIVKGPSAEQLESDEPLLGIDHKHWCDLRAGAALMDIRKAAIEVLDALEARLIQMRDNNERVCMNLADAAKWAKTEIEALQSLSRNLCDRVEKAKERISTGFARDCSSKAPQNLILDLVKRDGSVVGFREEMVVAGPAIGDRQSEQSDDDLQVPIRDQAFAPQLYRLFNFHCLVKELKGEDNPACRSAIRGERQ